MLWLVRSKQGDRLFSTPIILAKYLHNARTPFRNKGGPREAKPPRAHPSAPQTKTDRLLVLKGGVPGEAEPPQRPPPAIPPTQIRSIPTVFTSPYRRPRR